MTRLTTAAHANEETILPVLLQQPEFPRPAYKGLSTAKGTLVEITRTITITLTELHRRVWNSIPNSIQLIN